MLGVTPSASLQTSKASSPKANGSGSTHEASVRAAWKGAEMELESGEEPDDLRQATNGHEDESRYDIQDKRQPPAKRRRTGTQRDAHTVYTSDEDDDEADNNRGGNERLVVHADLGTDNIGHSSGSDSDSVAAEESEYDVFSDNKTPKNKRNRSFWLSKGVVDLS